MQKVYLICKSIRTGRSKASNHQKFDYQLHQLVWRLTTHWLVALDGVNSIKI